MPKKLLFKKMLLIVSALWLYGVTAGQTVTGKVTDQNNVPIAGATIQDKKTTKAVTTNDKGEFTINAPQGSQLVISTVGYKPQEITVSSSGVIIKLEQTVDVLTDVVVVGYGTRKKKDLTGAVSTVEAGKLQTENPNSLQDVLRGNVAGLSVGFSTGAKPGGSLLVRGVNSFRAGTSPLIVLDGVIYYGAWEDINPDDIETVNVLKDASSVAVYGAKAASGVIAITTKRGRSEKPVINFNANIGLVTMEVNQRPYDTGEFLKFREDVQYSRFSATAKPYQYSDPRTLPSNISTATWLAYDNSSGDPLQVWFNRLNMKPIEFQNYMAGHGVNWYNEVFDPGFQQDYNISVSARKKDMSYFWSIGYLNNEGLIFGDKYSTLRSRLNLEGTITKFLTIGTNTQLAFRNESGVPVDWNKAITNSPLGSKYADDGITLRQSPNNDFGINETVNPFLENGYTTRVNQTYTLNTSIYARITLPFGIKLQSTYNTNLSWWRYYNTLSIRQPGLSPASAFSTRQNTFNNRWQVDNILSWERNFGKDHHFEVTLLANAERYNYWSDAMTGRLFVPNDDLGYHLMDAATIASSAISSYDEKSTAAAYMSRLFYSFKNRYLLTLSIRRDGYSAFGQNNPYADFPSAAVGWVFSDENFIKIPWLTNGKLRASYGVNGNRDFGIYPSLSNLSSGQYQYVTTSGALVTASQLWVSRMSNRNLKWERTAALNLGLDFSILRGLLDGTVEVYKGRTKDALVTRLVPNVTGFNNINFNLGKIENKGLEITLSSSIMNKGNFRWNASGNFSLNRNKVVSLYGVEVDIKDANGNVIGRREPDDKANGWFIGQPLDVIWDQRVIGVWQSDFKDSAAKYGVKPGDFQVLDVNNDKKYTDDDRQFLGFTRPRFRWTLRNDFSYKNFSLSLLVYSLWGHKASYNAAKNQATNFGIERVNYYKLPYWTTANPINDYARLNSSNGSATYSVYRDRSFIRLSNVSLSYDLPKKLASKASMQSAKVFFTVRNAAVWAPHWDFWDPESSGPTPRTFTLGVNLTL
jgi:TonB-linked SusC/RagA family outer membrane protein